MNVVIETLPCKTNETLPLLPQGAQAVGHRLVEGIGPEAVGQTLVSIKNSAIFVTTGFVWLPGANLAEKCPLLTASAQISAPLEMNLKLQKQGQSIAVITLSDKGASGERVDTAGPALVKLLGTALEISLVQRYLIPDSNGQLRALLSKLALDDRFDLICTCGGTGLGSRDITPQTTKSVLDFELPGFAESMRAASLAKTPNAIISRAVCGVIGKCLVLNLPGSRRAAEENLAAVLPALDHSLRKLQGDTGDCGG